ERVVQDLGELTAGNIMDSVYEEIAIGIHQLIDGEIFLVQVTPDAKRGAELQITGRTEDAAEGNVGMRLDRPPPRWKHVEEPAIRLQYPVNFREGQFLFADVLEH